MEEVGRSLVIKGCKRVLVDMSGVLCLEVCGDEGLMKEKDNEDRERG